MARFGFGITALVAIICAVTMLAPARAAHARRTLEPPATVYRYAGSVYDRFFSASSRPRFVRTVRPALRDPRLRTLATAPYAITDLTPIAGNALPEPDPSLGFGFPTAVDNAGRIPYYDECGCVGDYNDITLEINDSGTLSTILYETSNFEGEGYAIPTGVSPSGNIAGVVYTYYGDTSSYEQVIAWLEYGARTGYQSGAVDQTYALGINDAGVSVGNDTGAKGSFAALFRVNARGAVGRKMLLPPKATSWSGVATGIDDAGEIVGYATFPNSGNGRAVRFYPTGNARVIPVAAAGVSTAAQAINAHGDIVGAPATKPFFIASSTRHVSAAANGRRGRRCRRLRAQVAR